MTAKIKLNAASGGGSFSLQAPSSSSNNRVFTLPDIADATMATVNGITMADQWRLTVNQNISGSTEVINANWERTDNAGYGQIGTGMSQSSGIFTFPQTGIYLISFNLTMYSVSQTQRYCGALIDMTVNNNDYGNVAVSYANGGVSSGSGVYMAPETKFIADITDTTQRKVRFTVQAEYASAAIVASDTNANLTFATFIRLGDT